jgi:hypothetical protein
MNLLVFTYVLTKRMVKKTLNNFTVEKLLLGEFLIDGWKRLGNGNHLFIGEKARRYAYKLYVLNFYNSSPFSKAY